MLTACVLIQFPTIWSLVFKHHKVPKLKVAIALLSQPSRLPELQQFLMPSSVPQFGCKFPHHCVLTPSLGTPFLGRSSHILTIGLPRGSPSDSFLALFWETTGKEFCISQNFFGEKKPNKRLGSHPVCLPSHDVIELPSSPVWWLLATFVSLPSSPLGERHPIPDRVGLPQRFSSQQKHVTYTRLQLLGAEFITQQTLNPRGYVTEYSWTQYTLEQADKAKSKRCMCLH